MRDFEGNLNLVRLNLKLILMLLKKNRYMALFFGLKRLIFLNQKVDNNFKNLTPVNLYLVFSANKRLSVATIKPWLL